MWQQLPIPAFAVLACCCHYPCSLSSFCLPKYIFIATIDVTISFLSLLASTMSCCCSSGCPCNAAAAFPVMPSCGWHCPAHCFLRLLLAVCCAVCFLFLVACRLSFIYHFLSFVTIVCHCHRFSCRLSPSYALVIALVVCGITLVPGTWYHGGPTV